MPKKQPLAFPSETLSPQQPGMNLRDYFASCAIAGAHVHLDEGDRLPEEVAKRAYQIADAMMAERGVN